MGRRNFALASLHSQVCRDIVPDTFDLQTLQVISTFNNVHVNCQLLTHPFRLLPFSKGTLSSSLQLERSWRYYNRTKH